MHDMDDVEACENSIWRTKQEKKNNEEISGTDGW